MSYKQKPTRWYRYIPPLAILVIALVAGFWEAGAETFFSRVTHLFIQQTATATQPGEESDEVCTKPCCAGKQEEAAAKACCPNCTVSGTASEGIQPCAGEGDTCCPPGKTAAALEGDACCPPKDAATSSAVVPTGIQWTKALIQEYKNQGDWCASHGVPESMCVRCNPALVETFKAKGDWCSGHDLPESLCTVCNKDLIPLGIGRDWCEEHGLPESQCTLCNPKKVGQVLPGSFLDQARFETFTIEAENAGKALEEALSGTTDGYSKDQRNGINPDCPLHHMKIRLKSPEVAREANLRVEAAGTRQVDESLKCYGDIQFDRARYAVLSSRARGL